MEIGTLRRLWKNEYFQTTIMIIVIIAVVWGVWLGAQSVLGTPYPILTVASGSMCKVQHPCDGWSHPFEPTLHKGDLIIIRVVNPKDVVTGSDPEGDIIIFHQPKPSPESPDDLIVHRAIANVTRSGIIYFRTKGDGNPGSWDTWTDYRESYDTENYTYRGMISERLLVGKVIMRVPWVGQLSLLMHDSSGIYIVVTFIILLVIIELAIPTFKGTKTKEKNERPQETQTPAASTSISPTRKLSRLASANITSKMITTGSVLHGGLLHHALML